MALRTSKITSEIIQTCNKYFSTTSEASASGKILTNLRSEPEAPKPQQPFRYKIANTEKPQDLPELNFHDDSTPLFAELQPCANPEFRFEYSPPKWAEGTIENSPFPASLKPKTGLNTYSDLQKAEDKLVKFKMLSFNPATRHFSMSVRHYGRDPADNNSESDCGQKIDKCAYREKKKECKLQDKACPKYSLDNCEQSQGSKCELRYLDTNCEKKFAPYPSYSESCAEQLPDDPSECHQCPWRSCDGADSIVPGKPVKGRRHYSTSCHRHLNATGGVVTGPLVPPPVDQVQEHICGNDKCGLTKPPCKEPPGPCEVRKQIEEQKKYEKTKREKPTRKNAPNTMEGMILSGLARDGLNIETDQYNMEPIGTSIEGPSITNKSSWIDILEGPEVFFGKKRRPPHCQKKQKPRRPKQHTVIEDMSIEIGDVDWWTGRGKKTVLTEDDGPKECRIEDCTKCPKQQIRSKQDMLLAKPEMLLKKKKIKGDEGHPPPCEDDRSGKSYNCPTKPLKKPKYQKRPMKSPYYRQPEDPYYGST